MKPFRAFLFLLFVLSSFLFIYYLKEVSHKEAKESLVVQNGSTDNHIPLSPKNNNKPVDTIPATNLLKDTLAEALPIVSKKLFNPVPFEFSQNDSLGFRHLFKKLDDIKNEQFPVRIIYFGDSQIENDRITSTLRKGLQSKFGGKGQGFIPLDHLYNPGHQLILERSKNWEILSEQDEGFKNNSLLFKNAVFSDSEISSWFSLKRIKSLGPKPDYELMKLYYQLNGTCKLEVENSGNLIYSGKIPNNGVSRILDFQFNRTPDNIKFNFVVNGLLKVLGISLETKNGVLVDNIALRGLSYPTFAWSDQDKIRTMIEQINPGLFIFHFGVNLVPYQSDDYFYFRKHFKQQVLFLKENYPSVPLLIVGVSDMARKHKGRLESYPNVQQIKMIQKEIAFETGSVFWDLEAFMGGRGGMIRWANAKPKLGRTDYTHFSKEGARKIGQELSRMILEEFKKDRTRIK